MHQVQSIKHTFFFQTTEFADSMHRTGTDDLLDATHSEHIPITASTEIFWDTFDHIPLDLQGKHSVSSFGDLASNNDSGYWTDSDQVTPWSQYNGYPAFPDSLEGMISPPAIEPKDNSEIYAGRAQSFPSNVEESTSTSYSGQAHDLIPQPHQDPSSLSDETSDQTYTSLLLEDPGNTVLQDPAAQSDEALICSDDPFMGWASKKANHLFDDYGWVLSHVENL